VRVIGGSAPAQCAAPDRYTRQSPRAACRDSWYGFAAPAKAPRASLDYFHGEIVKALNAHDLKEKLGQPLGRYGHNNPQNSEKECTPEVWR
jgi:hypothetical protein